MKANEIVKATLKFGGFTDTETFKGRFSVGIKGFGIQLSLEQFTEALVESHKRTVNALGYTLGTWHDKETNTVWLDAVKGYETKEEALSVAEASGELAIYDLVEGREIRL